jgi:hypothetical protein
MKCLLKHDSSITIMHELNEKQKIFFEVMCRDSENDEYKLSLMKHMLKSCIEFNKYKKNISHSTN